NCDPQPSPVAAGTVGLFEGADYYHCGVWRPEFNCRMRNLSQPFCGVCQQAIVKKLTPFLPA
ncbi:MAG TPA: M64 family metallopeptidase, partial [Pyrinomonadaceae bacterium]|nr:M64 family metallopeptidase [Pyrinomonadaceae bacterium]